VKHLNAILERFGLPPAKVPGGERTPFGSAAAYLAQLEAKFDAPLVKSEAAPEPEKSGAPDA
jgi:hypothetical protein